MKQNTERALDLLIASRGNKFEAISNLIADGFEKKEAIWAVNDAYAELDTMTEKGEMLFSDYISRWMPDCRLLGRWKKSTAESNEPTIIKNFQKFYNLPLNQINREIINQWITDLCSRNLSSKTVRNNYSLLHAALEDAVEREYISFNPAEGIRLPKSVKQEASSFNQEEVKILTKAILSMPAAEQDYKVGLLLALYGGLRKGEICGLNEEDVDFKNSRITIRRNRLVGNNGVYEDTLKTASSFRTISMPDKVMEEIDFLIRLHDQKVSCKLWVQSPELLKNRKGNPIYPKMIYKRLKKLLKETGLADRSLHSLRHTHVSMLISSGANIEDVKRRLGHSCNSTTLNIYTHLFHSSDAELAGKIGSMYLKG